MERKEFQAESKRLLELMIHSIYTHKEIFLREILSNASDAIDKLCYRSLTDEQVGMKREDFAITIRPDQEARTLTVSDNGIGMNDTDLEQNLGVIASSGTFQFRQELDKDAESDVIGQFGVGFYSAFMVADHITVVTRKYGDEQGWRWESDGVEGYTIEPCRKDTVGTDIIMHLKADRGAGGVQPVPAGAHPPASGEEVLRLYPLPHPYGNDPLQAQGGLSGGQAGV